MKRALIVIVVALALLVTLAAVGNAKLTHFLDTPVSIVDDGIAFEIESGASLRSVAAALEQRGIISSARMLRIHARLSALATRIQAGDYFIAHGTTPRELLEQFTNGAVRLYAFTIIEGWNRWDLLRALQDHPELDATLTDEDWTALLESLGAATTNPEGLFLPETYNFARNTTDRELLKQAYELMQRVLEEEWENRSDAAIVASPYEALILASIIEKETARADERERIAGVFTRRLEKRMRLQTDPTVIYGIGKDFNGNLTRKDMQTATPYNTYTQGGLPPTPIAMPGRAAVHAALHPADGDEIFFVASGLGDGSHQFSATKEEHDAAVAAYLRQLRKQRNKD